MSDTVIVVQDECILVAVGKAGRPPKVQKVERIPLNGFGDPIELWKEARSEERRVGKECRSRWSPYH